MIDPFLKLFCIPTYLPTYSVPQWPSKVALVGGVCELHYIMCPFKKHIIIIGEARVGEGGCIKFFFFLQFFDI
jgi:hypothetical protein